MTRRWLPVPLALLTAVLAASLHRAQTAPEAAAQLMGFSDERLQRLDGTMREYVERGRIAGVVTLLARAGTVVHLESYGLRDREAKAPMQKDTIFRIASMTKAVTSVAALMLMEEGRLLLSDPVSKFIPAFKKTTVGATGARSPAVPARREITIRDLLTHTAGVSYGSGPVEGQYKAANIWMWYFADRDEPMRPIMERLAALPFEAQPGEKYVYGFSTDILGVVVEAVSGLSLDEFFRRRIFEPLRMTDTSFFLPLDKRDRLAVVYAATPAGLERAPDPGRGQGDYVDGPRRAFSGGAGLLSTASDYARFLQMLLNGGELDGVRLLGPKTVELATTNHVGALFNDGRTGFSLGFEVVDDVGRAGRPGSVGEFGWGGAYYTSYYVDPRERLVAVFMAQLLPSDGLDLQGKFRALTYQAIVAPPPARTAAAQ